MAYNLGTAHGEITIGYDDRGVLRARDSMGRFVSTAGLMGDSMDDVDRRGNLLTSMFSRMSSVLKFVSKWVVGGATAFVALGQTIGVVVAAAQQLTPVLESALSFLPGIILSAVAALVVLKVAIIGVGDAIKAGLSGDLDKFNEALKKLAPNARSFAVAVRDAAASLKPLQQGLQNELFTGFAAGTSAAAKNLKLLGPAAGQVAVDFNRIGQEILKFASGPTFIAGLNGALTAVSRVLQEVKAAIQPVLEGFFSLAAQISVFSQPFGAGITQALQSWGYAMKNINLAETFQSARDAIAPFAALLQNLGGIASAFFQAFSSGGADALGVIGQLAAQINTFLSSDAGTAALMALGQAMQAIAGAAGQALLGLLQAIAPAIIAISPSVQALAQLIGGALMTAFQILGPAVTQIATALNSALMPVFAALEPAISSLLSAIAPLVALLGGVFASVLGVLGPLLAQVATIIAGLLTQAISILIPVIQPLLEVFTVLIGALLPPLMPLLQALATILGAVLTAVTPLIQVFTSLLAPVLIVIATALGTVIGWIAQLITWIAQGIAWVAQIVAAFLKWALMSETAQNVFNAIKNAVVTIFNAVVQFIGQKVEQAKQTFQNIAQIVSIAANIFGNMVNTVKDRMSAAFNAVKEFPGKVTSAIGNLGGLLVSAGRDLIQGLINGISNMAGAVIQKAKDIANAVSSTIKGALGISSPSKVMIQVGEWTSEGLAIGIQRELASVARAAEAAAQAVFSALPNNYSATVDQVLSAASLGTASVSPAPAAVSTTPSVGPTVNVNVNAPQSMNPNDVGQAVAGRVVLALQAGA